MTLKELDAEIARRRGWAEDCHGGWWIGPSKEVTLDPPPFSSSWEWTGALLEEMSDGGQVNIIPTISSPLNGFREAFDVVTYDGTVSSPAIKEAIARAWLAGKKGE